MRQEAPAFFTADTPYNSRPRLWLIILLFCLIGWGIWFFAVPLPITANSSNATFSSDDQIVAYFPPDTALRLRPDQPVQIRLPQYPWTEFGTGRGVVIRLDSQIRNGQVKVEIQMQTGLPQVEPQRDLEAEVIVTTTYETMAQLLWRELVSRTMSE